MSSKRFRLNKKDGKSIAVGACIALGAALLTYLAEIVGQIDFGEHSELIVAIAAILINTARKSLEGEK